MKIPKSMLIATSSFFTRHNIIHYSSKQNAIKKYNLQDLLHIIRTGIKKPKLGVILVIITIELLNPLKGKSQNDSIKTCVDPNIILIMVDDMGYGDLSCHGSPDVRTPNIDNLYEQSVRFTDFQVSSTCAPTRSAIMTGKAPFKNGITHTIYERERMNINNITIAQVLKSEGYTTGIFGKWHLGDEESYQPDQRGFDEVFIHGAGGIGQRYSGSCADVPGNRYINPIIKHNGIFVQTKDFCTNVFFQQAMGWIKEQSDEGKPFFAYIATNAPHAPYIAPKNYRKKFKKAGYNNDAQGFYGMVENIDDNIGLLLKKLEEWKLEDNTILIFMSDNGKALLNNYERKSKVVPDAFNAGMKGYKGSIHEGGTRVPLFIRWKNKIQGDIDIPVLCSHYDLFPTLMEIAGAEIPDGIDGESLFPLIKGKNLSWQDRYRFFHIGRWNPGENPDYYKYKGFAVRNEKFRLINNVALYDVENDPEEKNNVISEHMEIAAQMLEAYERWWDEVRPLMVNEEYKFEGEEPPFIKEYLQQKEENKIQRWSPPKL